MNFVLAYWKILAVVGLLLVAGAAVGVSRLQLANCRADAAEIRSAYELLADRVRQQNTAVLALEQAAKEAAARARQAREAASATVRIAEGRAAGLEAALRAPREATAGECAADEAVRVVRADLAAR